MPAEVRLGFGGQEQEDDLGLINMGGRIYDPSLARFLTPDPLVTEPLNAQSYHPYGYALNSPLRFTDPTGFEPENMEGGGGFGYEPGGSGVPVSNGPPSNMSLLPSSPNVFGFSGLGAACPVQGTSIDSEVGKGTTNSGSTARWWERGYQLPRMDTSWMSTPWLDRWIWGPATALVNWALKPGDCGGGNCLYGTVYWPGMGLGGGGGGPGILQRLNPSSTAVYRGGTSMAVKPNEIRVDANGMVRPTHGVSLSTNPAGLERFGGARQIKNLPEGLQIIQRGSNVSHYEIVPTEPMKPEAFQELLNQVEFH
jgi:RHS repeat-associated protein